MATEASQGSESALNDDVTDNLRAIAAHFVEARRRGASLAAYPGAMPQSLAEAYAIQAHAIVLRGGHVGGWKLGRINGEIEMRQCGSAFVLEQLVRAWEKGWFPFKCKMIATETGTGNTVLRLEKVDG